MKKIIAIVLLLVMMIALCGCNKMIIDTNYHFDKAKIYLPNGDLIEGPIKAWDDYDDCDMVTVVMADGTMYYTHGSNVLLIGTR